MPQTVASRSSFPASGQEGHALQRLMPARAGTHARRRNWHVAPEKGTTSQRLSLHTKANPRAMIPMTTWLRDIKKIDVSNLAVIMSCSDSVWQEDIHQETADASERGGPDIGERHDVSTNTSLLPVLRLTPSTPGQSVIECPYVTHGFSVVAITNASNFLSEPRDKLSKQGRNLHVRTT